MMEHLLFRDQHKEWLGAIIDSRDRMNHCQAGGMKIQNVAVYRNSDGIVSLPRWSDQQSLADAMDGVCDTRSVPVTEGTHRAPY
jgi:hypothetical protein